MPDDRGAQQQPRTKIDFGDLTEAVTLSVRRALAEHRAEAATADAINPIRIILGLIFEEK